MSELMIVMIQLMMKIMDNYTYITSLRNIVDLTSLENRTNLQLIKFLILKKSIVIATVVSSFDSLMTETDFSMVSTS